MNQNPLETNFSYFTSPIDIRSILTQLPCLHNQQLAETIKVRLKKDNLVKHWVNIVGLKLAEHTEPVAIQNQKIVVAVDEPKWMSAIQQTEKKLNKKINEFFKLKNKRPEKENPYAIKLILGKISSPVQACFMSSSTGDPELDAPELDGEEITKIERLLRPIKNNEKLRQVLNNILVRHCQHNRNS